MNGPKHYAMAETLLKGACSVVPWRMRRRS